MKLDYLQYEAVLSYCIDRTLSGYENAICYGKLCGFLTSDNELTANGKKVAKYPCQSEISLIFQSVRDR